MLAMEKEQKESNTQKEEDIRDYLWVHHRDGEQLQVLTCLAPVESDVLPTVRSLCYRGNCEWSFSVASESGILGVPLE